MLSASKAISSHPLRRFLPIAFLLALPSLSAAQAPFTLAPLATDQTLLTPSNLFGVPLAQAVNEAGDYVFAGARGTALFYKANADEKAHRVVQTGEDIAPFVRLSQIFEVSINATGVAVVRAEVFLSGDTTQALFSTNGSTMALLTLGTNGAPDGGFLGPQLRLLGWNDAGDTLFSAKQATVLYWRQAGGATVKIAAPGDPSPGTGGTFSSVNGWSLSNTPEALFSASISGGSGASGLFAWRPGTGTRKVVATGDANPSPVGGTFSDLFTTTPLRWALSDNGTVVFAAASSIYVNTSGGTTTVAYPGLAIPGAGTVTTSAPSAVYGINATGGVAFGVATNAGFGLVRRSSAGVLDLVAQEGTLAPSTAFLFNSAFSSATINSQASVSFLGRTAASQAPLGLFQKTLGGSLGMVWAHLAVTPAGGQIFMLDGAAFATADNRVFVRGHVVGITGPTNANHGHFFALAGAAQALMHTGETLPAGARVVVGPQFLSTGGPFVGFWLQRGGGRESLGVASAAGPSIVATTGSALPFSGGDRILITPTSSVLVGAGGTVAFTGVTLGGATATARASVFASGVTFFLSTIVADGQQDSNSIFLSNFSLAFSGVRPSPVNQSPVVVFHATGNGTTPGIWAGSGGTRVKVALVGDAVSTGTLTGIVSGSATINDSGLVLFAGSTAAGPALFTATPGGAITTIVQAGSAAPGGGTFANFSTSPAFTSAGVVTFMASTTGGPGGGIYFASPGNPAQAIVLHGAPTPAGGTYILNVPRPDVVTNDSNGVSFFADIAGGPAATGIFVRQTPASPIETVVVQGQAAPGMSGGTFDAFSRLDGYIGQPHALSAEGDVAFRGASGGVAGWWHRQPDSTTSLVMRMGSADAVYDGGTVRGLASLTSWLPGRRLPLWAPVYPAAYYGGLYLWTPAIGATTNPGAPVGVSPVDPLTSLSTVGVAFASVTSGGVTKLTRTSSGPPLPRAWYKTTHLRPYFRLETTATGVLSSVCIDVTDHGFAPGAVARLLRHDGANWIDITTGMSGNSICGAAAALGTFVVAHALNEPSANYVQNGGFSAGSNNWLKFEEPYISWSVNAGVFEYYRTQANAAVVFQNTGAAVAAGAPLVARFDVGNSSSVRKRFSVLLHNATFDDLSVCTFWLPPNAPMRTYAMRSHTTRAWANASISIYAASIGSDGGVYRLDNVVMGPGHDLTTKRTDCVDPLEPGDLAGPDSAPLVVNGSFSQALAAWLTFGTITAQGSGSVAEFIRPTDTQPSGVIYQPSGDAAPAGKVVVASFKLGNSSAVRKRITVLLHDLSFTDLSACTFYLEPGQALSTYSMRSFTTIPWTSATISFYPATTGLDQWYRLDDVGFHLSGSARTYGSDCVEPNDFSGLSD